MNILNITTWKVLLWQPKACKCTQSAFLPSNSIRPLPLIPFSAALAMIHHRHRFRRHENTALAINVHHTTSAPHTHVQEVAYRL